MSDNINTRQPAVIPAAAASAAGVRGGRRRKAATVAGAVLGAVALAGGGFFAGAAVGRDSAAGDAAAAEIAYESMFFGSASLGSSSAGSSSGRDGADQGAPAGDSAAGQRPVDGPDAVDAGQGAGQGAQGRSADGRAGQRADGAPEPESGKGSSGRTGFAVQGDVIEIEGEDVLVCATGNGFGLSHIGVTLAEGADGDATRADSERLCSDAFRLTGALVLGNRGGELLASERDIKVGDRSYECRPVADKVLRCTADDGSLVTLWSAAP